MYVYIYIYIYTHIYIYIYIYTHITLRPTLTPGSRSKPSDSKKLFY